MQDASGGDVAGRGNNNKLEPVNSSRKSDVGILLVECAPEISSGYSHQTPLVIPIYARLSVSMILSNKARASEGYY